MVIGQIGSYGWAWIQIMLHKGSKAIQTPPSSCLPTTVGGLALNLAPFERMKACPLPASPERMCGSLFPNLRHVHPRFNHRVHPIFNLCLSSLFGILNELLKLGRPLFYLSIHLFIKFWSIWSYTSSLLNNS